MQEKFTVLIYILYLLSCSNTSLPHANDLVLDIPDAIDWSKKNGIFLTFPACF